MLIPFCRAWTPAGYCGDDCRRPAGWCPSGFPWGHGDNPKTVVWKYLETHSEFEIDDSMENKLIISVAPRGFLRRKIST
ncbi:CmcI family methyltransferase [Mycobacterium sp. 1245852.3]|uniref:CmcI family methyltransferase n=1 Tax=Mycobacterium sp. 1245852.3 TaxID=1856860 RepID=UPI0018D3556F